MTRQLRLLLSLAVWSIYWTADSFASLPASLDSISLRILLALVLTWQAIRTWLSFVNKSIDSMVDNPLEHPVEWCIVDLIVTCQIAWILVSSRTFRSFTQSPFGQGLIDSIPTPHHIFEDWQLGIFVLISSCVGAVLLTIVIAGIAPAVRRVYNCLDYHLFD